MYTYQKAHQSKASGVFYAFASALALSMMGILGKVAFEQGLEPISIVTWRAVIAFFGFLAFFVLAGASLPKYSRSDLLSFSLLGAIGISLNYLAFFSALTHVPVSVAISILYTYPIFVVIGSSLLFQEKMTLLKICVLGTTVFGCILVTRAHELKLNEIGFLGVFWAITASVTKSYYTLQAKILLARFSAPQITLSAFGIGAFFLVLFSLSTGHLNIPRDTGQWALIIAIAIIPTLIGYALFILALEQLESGFASIIASIEPVAATLLALFIPSESISAAQTFGIALIVSGVVAMNLGDAFRRGL